MGGGSCPECRAYVERRTPIQYERDVCRFYEAVLRVEYPGRRIAVTPAPIPEALEAVAETIDRTGVLDVTIGPLPKDPPWACFRVSVQREMQSRAWVHAAQKVLSQARAQFEKWHLRASRLS